jgi:hypothetical protein
VGRRETNESKAGLEKVPKIAMELRWDPKESERRRERKRERKQKIKKKG